MRIYLSGTTCPAVVALLPWATWNHFGLFQVFLNIFHSANWNIFSLFFVRHFLNVICTSGSLWRQGQTITTGFTLVTALNRTCCHLGRDRWEMEREREREACGQRGVKVAKNLCRLQGIQAVSRILLSRQSLNNKLKRLHCIMQQVGLLLSLCLGCCHIPEVTKS